MARLCRLSCSPVFIGCLPTDGKMTNSKGTLVIGYNSSEHTPATELIGSNVDILTEILTCVPAKFVIRFKCVSKDWFSLISNSPFSRNHSNRYPSALFSGLFINPVTSFDDEKVKSVSLHGQHQSLPTSSLLDGVGYGSGTCRIEDSCKGLLLCLNGPTCFIVCNLTTQKYTVLPYHSGTKASSVPFHNKFGVFLSSMFGGYLAFDPSKSPHHIVVLVSYIRNSDGCFYLIDIYSSESTSWTHMRAAAPPGYPFAKKVFWNGSIHWMSYDNVYIRFDVDAEKLIGTRMPLNPKILSEERVWYFGECCGHLLLVQCCDMGFRILEMERNYCYWIEKYQVNLSPIISLFPEIERSRHMCDPPIIRKIAVLCVVKGANEKDFTLVLSIPGKIVSYNLKCKTVKVLCDYRTGFYECPGYKHISSAYAFKYVYEFYESLSIV
ncbi:F-box protein At5g07610-like isoform X3 [Camellia sinensis]|uniref:F-box protein At5g07610-like isoform X3 n=1 Tax=Camellia sinensis TaxID=4442 RepID=UPI001035AC65|nr:F-box protein At5g07610-like isoform X3 [Camellia sinensis]